MTKSREYLRKLCNPAYKIWWCTLRGGGAWRTLCAATGGDVRDQGSGIRGTGGREAAGNRQQATGNRRGTRGSRDQMTSDSGQNKP